MGKKRIVFSLVLNVICVITSLIYPVYAVSYLALMISLAVKGGSADWMNFMALLILAFSPVAAAAVLPLRIVTLANVLAANSGMKKGVPVKKNLTVAGVLQLIDIPLTFFGFAGIIIWIHTVAVDKILRAEMGSLYEKNYWPVLIATNVILGFPVIVRAIAQIASSIMLFGLKKTIIKENVL
jgi:hypothetical protein